MAGSFTDGFEVDILKAVTAQTTTILTTTALANLYMGLTTTTPSDSAAGTEVSGGSYARQDTKTKWATPASGAVSTNAVITFPTATADWGTVTHFELWTASSGGTRLAWGSLNQSKTVSNGDTASVASGGATITLD